MRIHRTNFAAIAITLATVTLAPSVPASAEPVETEAVIVTHHNGTIVARTREGEITVTVSHATKIREKKGLSRKAREPKALIPGLIVKIEGDQQGQTIAATEIDFKESDWRSAIASKAGTTEQFAELRNAIIEGQEYVIRRETTVYFQTGKATISPSDQAHLRELAKAAPTYGNYRISLLGYADPRGNAAANERLSLKRAHAVSTFLRQTGAVDPGRVLAPSAMGEAGLAPGQAAPATDAEARRVVVRVVMPKTQLTR